MDAPAPLAPAPAPGPAPRLGDYAVTARLERRSAADVYEATHVPTGAARLVYVLRPNAMQQPGLVHRLAHEVDAARWLRHPAVAKVDACAETPNGRLYVATERPAGRSLAGVLAEGGRLGVGRVVRLGGRLVEALAEAHAVGLVHGHLTPAAVTVADGWDEGAHALVTLTGLGVGTVAMDDPVVGVDAAYTSPEQRTGAEPDERSDVFGLASLLHHALFGVAPAAVHAPTADDAEAGGLRVDAVEHLPAAVVLAAARSADPRCRPAGVKAFWEDLLDALVADADVEAAPRPAVAVTVDADGGTAEFAAHAPAHPDAPAFGAPAPAARIATPPSFGTVPARARRRVMTHALWLAVPLGGAAAAWPLGGRHTAAHASAAAPAVASPAAAAGEVTRPMAVAPAAAPGASATSTLDDGTRDRRRTAGQTSDRPTSRTASLDAATDPERAQPAPAPAADTARPAPGAEVAMPMIYVLPAEASRPARPVSRPDDFPDRIAPKPAAP